MKPATAVVIPEPALAAGTAPLAWVPILAYHRIVPTIEGPDPFRNSTTCAAFESHLRWLSDRGYTSLPLGSVGVKARWGQPRHSVVITFDDGYQDNFVHAWPILQRYGFTATIFIVTDAVGDWSTFDAPTYAPVPMLTADQIRQMSAGGIDFGSHSCSHPPSLCGLDDDRLSEELSRSKAVLEQILDAPVSHFSYPYSRHDARVEAAVRRAGYRLACAGTGTRFRPYRLDRVAPPGLGSAAVELAATWRRIKWRIRATLPVHP